MFFQKLPTQLNEEKYTLQELVLAQLDIDIQKKICLGLSLYQHKTTNSNCVIDPMIIAKSLKFSVGKNTEKILLYKDY